MKLKLIRNATMILQYSGVKILTDPMLAPAYSHSPLEGHAENPTVELPEKAEEFLVDVEFCIISHLHNDHFDTEAQKILPRSLPIICQPGDEHSIQSLGFRNVERVIDEYEYKDIKIYRVEGQHGAGIWADHMGCISGFVFKSGIEPTVYWTGDTILYDGVRDVIKEHVPEIIICHSGGESVEGSGPLTMDAAQTMELCRFSPGSRVVAIHMDCLDYLTVSRKMIREEAAKNGIANKMLLIPEDGQVLNF